MLFASLDFLLFFVPVLVLYWLNWHRAAARLVVVTLASYFFYMASARPPSGGLPTPWYFAGLLLFSTFLDFWAARQIHRQDIALDSDDERVANRARQIRKAFLLVSLVGNLGLLGYFKYSNFLAEVFVDVFALFGGTAVAPKLSTFLPIGISFYTFQTLSYTIDVWRRRLTPEPSFLRFAFFVVFFPQLVAGPIVRASEFLPQVNRRPRLSPDDIEFGLFRIWKGLMKKVVLGDYLAANLIDIVFTAPQDYTSLENLLGLYGFTLQIYGDFSGYSDIAIGVARLMGFRLPENFERPYQATHVGDFWRRWHMTLSTWLRDYLFFPLGGSKGSSARTYFNLWLTMFLVGMWHRARWTFVIYSNMHGLAMVFNRWNRTRTGKDGWWHGPAGIGVGALLFAGLAAWLAIGGLALPQTSAGVFVGFVVASYLALVFLPSEKTGKTWTAVHWLFMFHFTVLSRVFFRADDMGLASQMVGKLIAWDGLGVRNGFFRAQMAYAWADEQALVLGAGHAAVQWLANHTLLLIMLASIAYHLTPQAWVDKYLFSKMKKLPGVAWGLIFAATGVLLMKLLEGPRANIYFEF